MGYKAGKSLVSCCTGGKPEIVHHESALQYLASRCRMVSLTDKMFAWTLARAGDEFAGTRPEKHMWAVDLASREWKRQLLRFTPVNILEKAYMLEVQVSIFAISCSLLSGQKVDWQMLLSLMLSGITLLKVICDAISMAKGLLLREIPADMVCNEGVAAKMRDFLSVKTGYWVSVLVLASFLVHSLAKLIMVFTCEDSMWNIPSIFSTPPDGEDWKGCVDPSDIVRPS